MLKQQHQQLKNYLQLQNQCQQRKKHRCLQTLLAISQL